MNGDISAAIDSLQVTNYISLTKSNLIHLDGDHYATAIREIVASDGWLYTFTLDSNGNVSDVVTDSWEYTLTENGYSPVGLKVPNSDYVVLVSTDSTWDGQLRTIAINSGVITKSIVDTVKIFEYSECPHMCEQYTSGDNVYYIVATSGEYASAPANDGAMMLASVNTTNGLITNHAGIEFDTKCYMPQVIRITDDVVAVYCKSTISPGTANIRTYAVDTSTHSIGSQIDFLSISTEGGTGGPDMHLAFCHLVDDMYIFAHTDSSGNGHISTVEIDNDGNISDTVIDTYLYTGTAHMTDIKRISDDMIAIVYNSGGQISIDTYKIAIDGTINKTIIDTVQVHPNIGGYFCRLDFIEGSTNKWAVTYPSLGKSYIKTYAIEGTSISVPTGETIVIKDITFDDINITYEIK